MKLNYGTIIEIDGKSYRVDKAVKEVNDLGETVKLILRDESLFEFLKGERLSNYRNKLYKKLAIEMDAKHLQKSYNFLEDGLGFDDEDDDEDGDGNIILE